MEVCTNYIGAEPGKQFYSNIYRIDECLLSFYEQNGVPTYVK